MGQRVKLSMELMNFWHFFGLEIIDFYFFMTIAQNKTIFLYINYNFLTESFYNNVTFPLLFTLHFFIKM